MKCVIAENMILHIESNLSVGETLLTYELPEKLGGQLWPIDNSKVCLDFALETEVQAWSFAKCLADMHGMKLDLHQRWTRLNDSPMCERYICGFEFVSID